MCLLFALVVRWPLCYDRTGDSTREEGATGRSSSRREELDHVESTRQPEVVKWLRLTCMVQRNAFLSTVLRVWCSIVDTCLCDVGTQQPGRGTGIGWILDGGEEGARRVNSADSVRGAVGPSGKESRASQPSDTVLARDQHRRHGEQTTQTTHNESCRREEVALEGWARSLSARGRVSCGNGRQHAGCALTASRCRLITKPSRCSASGYEHSQLL